MSKGMTTCDVCGRDFALMVESHYISRAEAKTGIAAFTGGDEPYMHDAMDCPHCGCQKVLQKRERIWVPEPMVCEEREEEDDE